MQAHPRAGELVTTSTVGEVVRAFVPRPLPPEPPLSLTEDDRELIDRANRALGRLDGLGLMLPDTHLFVYLYIRKEAVLSSQIEGTQSSLSDQLRRGDLSWAGADARRVSAFAPPDQGDARGSPFERARQHQAAGAVPHEPELDRRSSTRGRRVRAPSG